MANWYLTREQFKGAIPKTGEGQDAAIDLVIEQASREIDALTNRRFIPKTELRNFAWPQRNGRRVYVVYLDEDLLSVDTLTKEGDDATAITDFLLEPQGIGPPYNRIEIDLASTAFFSAKDTHQRQIRVTGSWGYSDDTVTAGTINDASGITASETTVQLASPELIGVGDTLLMQDEQVFVSERILPDKFTIIRAVNGTTGATHADTLAITKYVPPADLRGRCFALASAYYNAGIGGWTGGVGSGEGRIQIRNSVIDEISDWIKSHYGRRVIGAV